MRFVAAGGARVSWRSSASARVDEMVGRVDRLEPRTARRPLEGARASTSRSILHQPEVGPDVRPLLRRSRRTTASSKSLDRRRCSSCAAPALERGEAGRGRAADPQRQPRRSARSLGSEVTRALRRARACPTTRSASRSRGSAGQSFGAFVPRGHDARRSRATPTTTSARACPAGRLIVYPAARGRRSRPRRTSSSATSRSTARPRGEAFIRGVAGERFCVRNSGADAVVEGVGDHGCEYMTGGRVVVLGRTGRNFAAGMSRRHRLRARRGRRLRSALQHGRWSDLEPLDGRRRTSRACRRWSSSTSSCTGSARARRDPRELGRRACRKFVKVMPHDYQRVLDAHRSVDDGPAERREMAAFEHDARDDARRRD
ncbi:MAG: hypothetical protein MZV65_54065 [Chromatiales bacterium]|nr:hypothetical protein [Chromatiales bacterium]